MKQEHLINEDTGQKVIASDELYWLKAGQVAFDIVDRDGTFRAAEQICDSWADFRSRPVRTRQIAKRPQGMTN